eukprot:scaffold108838_cov63-Phaeocystis_antarctica.AAC.3
MCDGLGAALLPHVSLARQEQRLLEGAGIYAAAKWKCFDVVVLIQLHAHATRALSPRPYRDC